jgi:ElaB/YqjD/DUF883 family membrane-anchored ribosome-binding protein
MFTKQSPEPSTKLAEQAAPLLDRATEQMSALTQRGADHVDEASRQLREKARDASEGTVNYIRHEPIKAVLIAAATGAALMALVSLASHSGDRH